MRTLLRSLRGILEHERDVYGDILPLDDDPPPEDDTPNDASAEARRSASTEASSVASKTVEAADPATPDDAPQEVEVPNAASSTDDAGDADDADPEPTTASSAPASDSSPDSSEATDAMPNRDLFGNEVNPAEDPSLPPWERIESLIPDDAPYKDVDRLEEVETFLADTVLVPIDEERENPVFGVGHPDADLVIIGEAPGRDEDKEGEPFVGRAGTLLDKILDAINFERDDVYITNILKSRPPRNRDPHAEEVEAHLPILYKQLALIRPKIILCVGKVAGNTMLDRSSSLSSLRDQEHDFYGIPTMVTYHPAALLRNSQWKRPTWEDVKLLRTRYDQLTNGEA